MELYRSLSNGVAIEAEVRLGVTLRFLAGASYLDLVTMHLITNIAMPNLPLDDTSALNTLSRGFQNSRTNSNPLFRWDLYTSHETAQ